MSDNRPIKLVLKGTCNPPVLASLELLAKATDQAAQATGRSVNGLLAPINDRHLDGLYAGRIKFPFDLRHQMCEGICTGTGFAVSDIARHVPDSRDDLALLTALSQEDPDSDYWLLMDYDIIRNAKNNARIDGILDRFGIVILSADWSTAAVKNAVKKDAVLSKHPDHVLVLPGNRFKTCQNQSDLMRTTWSAHDYDGLAAGCGFMAAAMLWYYDMHGDKFDGVSNCQRWLRCGKED